jgi:hypothetical protein
MQREQHNARVRDSCTHAFAAKYSQPGTPSTHSRVLRVLTAGDSEYSPAAEAGSRLIARSTSRQITLPLQAYSGYPQGYSEYSQAYSEYPPGYSEYSQAYSEYPQAYSFRRGDALEQFSLYTHVYTRSCHVWPPRPSLAASARYVGATSRLRRMLTNGRARKQTNRSKQTNEI